MGATARLPRRCRDTARHEATSPAPRPRRPARSRACANSGQAVRGDDARHCYRTRLSTLLIAGWPRQLISSECKYACAERPRVVINDVNLPGLATTETLTCHVNLNYFSEAVSWEGEERLADADSWRITSKPEVTQPDEKNATVGRKADRLSAQKATSSKVGSAKKCVKRTR